MIESCLAELRWVAPGARRDEASRAVLAALSTSGARSVGLGRARLGGAGALCLGTMGHAFSRWLRESARGEARRAVRGAAGRNRDAHAATGAARAADPAPTPAPDHIASGPAFPIDDANPEAGVRARRGAAESGTSRFRLHLQDMIERAATATGRRDHAAAIRYYRALGWARCPIEARRGPSSARRTKRPVIVGQGVCWPVGRALGLAVSSPATTRARPFDPREKGRRKGALPPQGRRRRQGRWSQHLVKVTRRRASRAITWSANLGLRLSDVGVLGSCTKRACPDRSRRCLNDFVSSGRWPFRLATMDKAADLVVRARLAGVAPEGIEANETRDSGPRPGAYACSTGDSCWPPALLVPGRRRGVHRGARRRREPRQTA